MGNDGGDIPRRKQLVKAKEKQEFPNQGLIAIGRSRLCNLTNDSLREPLAICRLGLIYNYENIVEALRQKKIPSKYAYIRKLSDLKRIFIDRAPESSTNYIACPISKTEFNGFNKFVALWNCGHIFSRKAFKQVQSKQKCLVCDISYQPQDVIDMNLQSAQLQKKRAHLIEKKKKKQASKEQKPEQGDQKPKVQVHLSPIDKLGEQFKDIVRQRKNFQELFNKGQSKDWLVNTGVNPKSLQPKQ